MDTKNTQTEVTSLIISLLEKKKSFSDFLVSVCNVIVDAFSPVLKSASIKFLQNEYKSDAFMFSSSVIRSHFETVDNKDVIIKLYFNSHDSLSSVQKEYTIIKKQLPQWKTVLKSAFSMYQLGELTHKHIERSKEITGIDTAVKIANKENTIDDMLQRICEFLPVVMQHSQHAGAEIVYDENIYTSEKFKRTQWAIKESFEIPNGSKGYVEVCYVQDMQSGDNDVFLQEERNFIYNLAALISGATSKIILKEVLYQNTERLKEIKIINAASHIIQKAKELQDVLSEICAILPDAFQYSDHAVVRIKYNKQVFLSNHFEESEWRIKQSFYSVSKTRGSIEVFYTKDFPKIDNSPFLKEEHVLLQNLAAIISGRVAKNAFLSLQKTNEERLKEMHIITMVSKIIEEENNVQEVMHRICLLLPNACQYSKYAACKITFEGETYKTPHFKTTPWMLSEPIYTIDNKKGTIEIVYLKKFPSEDVGPFLQEEQNVLHTTAKLINGFLNSCKGIEVLSQKNIPDSVQDKNEEFRKSLSQTKRPIQLYFNQQSLEKYVYLDMMKYKVKHILFVSTLYDAFMLESEDSFFEKFMGEIYQYSLFSLPRITGVSSLDEALELLETTSFDLIVVMAGIDKHAPITMSEEIRAKHTEIPIYLLLNKKNDLKHFENIVPTIRSVDKIFVWNGDSLIFFTMVKSIEDRVNVANDTKIGLVRVILLIEDSPLYYSRYLQTLYSIVFDQVRQILPEVSKNELNKICKMRSRPKILLARNYEEAISIFNMYKDFLLCVISDFEFERTGKLDKEAGVKFIQYARTKIYNLPVILQSSEEQNKFVAEKLGVKFLDKNSDYLIRDLTVFLQSYLGFGNFVFRDKDEIEIAEAKSLREFENLIATVPDDSFYLHAHQNQFSIWLMARGEIELAQNVNSIRVEEYENLAEKRALILEEFRKYREVKKRGKVITFEESATIDERNIVTFCTGSLGGKGRGLGFIDVLLYNADFSELSQQISILTPVTVVIGTDEFQKFITRNKLSDKIFNTKLPYEKLREFFAKGKLSPSLLKKIRVFVNQVERPIAVRSSSTSEDSLTHPFSGVFDTYVIPNSKTHKRKIVEFISDAIKMVYASVYSKDARVYFDAINHKVEDEKMAIVLQELVGSYHGEYYYPHVSGVAQSYNYYPVGNMKPEEGFAVAAVGLGTYVVNGWKSFRFSPKYPNVSVYGTKDFLQATQKQFYALKTTNIDVDFVADGEYAAMELLDIDVAEKHGTLKHCASVYNVDNDRIEAGLMTSGPRIINFANILQHNYIPLARTIEVILKTVEEAFGSPVEIEYAVDLEPNRYNKPTFYLLQIKPLLTGVNTIPIDFSKFQRNDLLLYSQQSLGNGEVSDITDLVCIPPELFDKLETVEMAAEIEEINKQMIQENRKYILLGPGRWGTRDRFLGVPVTWSQISKAKVIVETSLDNFPLDSSLGSHFFHNVTSMNIGYFSVHHNSASDFIAWDVIAKQKVIKKTKHCVHVRFKKSLRVLMDGKKKTSIIIL